MSSSANIGSIMTVEFGKPITGVNDEEVVTAPEHSIYCGTNGVYE